MGERKWMYVLRGNGESHAAWSDQMRTLGRQLLNLGPTKLQMTLTEAPPPKMTLFPFKHEPIAIFRTQIHVLDCLCRGIQIGQMNPAANASFGRYGRTGAI